MVSVDVEKEGNGGDMLDFKRAPTTIVYLFFYVTEQFTFFQFDLVLKMRNRDGSSLFETIHFQIIRPFIYSYCTI